MTGPRIVTDHLQHRRGRHLLPFFIAFILTPLGCSSDQPMAPTTTQSGPVAAAVGSHPRAWLNGNPLLSASAVSTRTTRPKASFSVSAQSTGSSGTSVLILADADLATTSALADTLTEAGFQVTIRSAPEYTWTGADPELAGFNAVIHLNGSTYDRTLELPAQEALSSFVQNGGGFIAAQWNGFESTPAMADLVLQTVGGVADGPEQDCAACPVNYTTVAGQENHPVLAGLGGGFSFTADGHDAGPAVEFESNPSTPLMRVTGGGPGVLVREFGSGKIVSFSFAPNYPLDESGELRTPTTLNDSNIKRLYINAVRWVAGSSSGALTSQTITFDLLPNRVYGDPAFTLNATASSGLPVSYIANGQCSVGVNLLSLTGAGSCTVTAQQAGNADYAPAEDVSRSFAIAKAPATISVGTEYTYDGTVKSAAITTSPAGLTGVTVTYSQNGSPVTEPINAGTYQVTATLDNPNYQAPAASGTLTINPAMPLIIWSPASLTAGTSLGSSQLNASATGINGVALMGNFLYNPTAGTFFASAGTASLSVQFTPSDPNYSPTSKTVSLSITSTIAFTGFFAPVKNLPYRNVVTGGSAVPVGFALTGYTGSTVLSIVGSPISVQVDCAAGVPENPVPVAAAYGSTVLQSSGESYRYIWKTSPNWTGTCRKLMLTLVDGSVHEALFRFAGLPRQSSQPANARSAKSLKTLR